MQKQKQVSTDAMVKFMLEMIPKLNMTMTELVCTSHRQLACKLFDFWRQDADKQILHPSVSLKFHELERCCEKHLTKLRIQVWSQKMREYW